jgi:hypothetical protein
MSGGKGGSQSSKVQIPKWIEEPTIRNLARAEQVARMGYQPYYGPEVAAFTPMQQQAMQSQYDAASAFGMAPMGGDAMAGMPTATEYSGGVRGYGSGDIFEQSVNEFQKRQPDQAAIYNQQFVGPDTGNYDVYAPGKQKPIMGSGGGEGMPSDPGGADPLTNLGGGAGNLGFAGDGFNPGGPGGMPGGMPIDYTTGQPFNPGNMTGPFVAQGMGAQIPGSPMIGGSNSGSSDPFDPFTSGRGGVTGTPVDFPKGESGHPDSTDLMIRNQMSGFGMPQVGINLPNPGMDFNVPPASGFSALGFNQSQFGQPPAMQAQLPIRVADPRQMQFGRSTGLFGMMGA